MTLKKNICSVDKYYLILEKVMNKNVKPLFTYFVSKFSMLDFYLDVDFKTYVIF